MIWASIRAREEILELLLEKGADITICDKAGFTALDLAIIHGNYKEALILKRAGLRAKSFDFYDLKREMFVDYKVNIPEFLKKLEDELEKNEKIFEKKPSSISNLIRKPEAEGPCH